MVSCQSGRKLLTAETAAALLTLRKGEGTEEEWKLS